MKVTINFFFVFLLLNMTFLSSCATIIGGSRYNAHIIVLDRPNAKIVYQGNVYGTGNATIKVSRQQASMFSFSVKEEGCAEQKFTYQKRSFRWWALVGTVIGFTATPNGVPLPWGLGVDLLTGALWKPDVTEKGLSKINYKNFKYEVNYTDCDRRKFEIHQLIDVIYLKNGTVIKGVIIEQQPTKQIKIQTNDGNINIYKVEEIEKIIREQE